MKNVLAHELAMLNRNRLIVPRRTTVERMAGGARVEERVQTTRQFMRQPDATPLRRSFS